MQLLFRHLATYNQWMNRKLYNAAAVLSDEQLTQDRGAFFGSIWATLNHIAVGDILWLRRVAGGFPHLAALAGFMLSPAETGLSPCHGWLFCHFPASRLGVLRGS